MALPTNNTNGILTAAPASISTPPPGSVTYFFNTSDSDRLYYKTYDDTVILATQGDCDPCTCEVVSHTMCQWLDALKNGQLTADQYTTLLAGGLSVSCINGTMSVEFTPVTP